MNSRNKLIKFLILFICVITSHLIYAQNPFKMLDKAENLINKGKFEKAIIQINNALNSHYCTCGDCARQVGKKANLLRYSINFKLGQFEIARQYLDSIWSSNFQIDSLKVLSYQAEYGKDFLSQKIDSSLVSAKLIIDETDHNFYAIIPIVSQNYSLKFKVNYSIFSEYPLKDSNEEKLEKWRKNFIESPIYRMIKERS